MREAVQGEVSRADRTVTVKGGRLTLADVRAFVAEMDQAGAAESTPVGGTVSWRGWLRQIKATAVRLGDDQRERQP